MLPNNLSATDALRRLLDGNKRFAAGTNEHPRESPARRIEIADAPQPFAIVLGCSDARVPPEIVFDQGLGDLFVVRVAGNVLDAVALASIEYAVAFWGIRLVLVLGHQNCGAVRAALEGLETNAQLDALIQHLATPIRMAGKQPIGQVEIAVKKNVEFVVAKLKMAKNILGKLVDQKELAVVGAYYQTSTGAVSLLE